MYICVYGSFRQALFNINRRKSDPSSEYVLSRSTFNPDDTTILKTSRSPSLMPLSILKWNIYHENTWNKIGTISSV